MKTKVLIVGGGITGLSLAYYLAKEKIDFLLIEKDAEPGGKIKTVQKEGFTLECGPNTILFQEPLLKEMINDLGLEKELIFANKDISGKRYIHTESGIHQLPTSPLSFIKTKLISGKDKWKILSSFRAKAIPDLNSLNVQEYFTLRFGESVANNLVNPFVTGIYAGNPKEMSFQYAFPKLYELEKRFGNLIKGFIKTRKDRPENLGIFSFRNGLKQLSDALGQQVSDKAYFSTEVRKIQKNTGFYEVFVKSNDKEETISAEYLVDTRNTDQIERSLDLRDFFPSGNYVPILSLHLGYQKKDLSHLPKGFGLLTNDKAGRSFLGALFSSNIFPHTAPEGYELITILIGGARNGDLIKNVDPDLIETIIADFSKCFDVKSRPVFTHHFYWKEAIPQYNLDHQILIASIEKFENAYPNNFLAGNYFNGVSIGDRIKAAHGILEKLQIEIN